MAPAHNDLPKLEEPLISAETADNEYDRPQIRLFKGQVILNPTISKLNFYAFLLFSTYVGAIIIPANLLFQPLLTEVYNMSTDARIDVTTIVQLSQVGIKMVVTPFLGKFCDKYGRRLFVILGVLFMSASIMIVPHLPSVYPYYIITQLGFELGMMFLVTAPLLADYIDYETKGRVAGLASVISYAASSITTFVVSTMDLKTNIPSKLLEIGILAFVIGFLAVIGLKGGAYHKQLFYDKKAEEAKKYVPEQLEQDEKVQEEEEQEEVKKSGVEVGRSKVKVRPELQHEQDSLLENTDPKALIDVNGLNLNASVTSRKDEDNEKAVKATMGHSNQHKPGFMAGIREAKRSPWILTGYICGFLSYANVMLVNTVLVNYCTSVIGNEDGANQAYALTNKHMIVSCVTSAVFGLILDRYNKFNILVGNVCISVVAVLLLMFSPTPYNWMAYVSMVLFGVDCAGFMTLTNQLITKYADPKYRASVFAVSSMFTVVGSSMTNILGVFLSKFDIMIPFYIYLGCAGVGLTCLAIIYAKKKNILTKL